MSIQSPLYRFDRMILDSYTIKTRLMSRLLNSKYYVYDYTSAVPCDSIIVKLEVNSEELVITINKSEMKLEVRSVVTKSNGSISTYELWKDWLSEKSLSRSCDLVKEYIEEVMDVGYNSVNLYSPAVDFYYEK